MSWSTSVTLWCDGKLCTQWTDQGVPSVKEARQLAAGDGWSVKYPGTVPRKRDLCPFHARHGLSKALDGSMNVY